MNFTGGNTLPNLGRRINWQLVTLAGALAVALSAGVLSGAFDRDSSPATTTATRPADAPVSRLFANDTFTSPSKMVYIIVGSETEAGALESAISTYAAAVPELAYAALNTHVVALENREQAAQFNDSLALSTAELMATNIGVEVIDLRETPPPAVNLGANDGLVGAGESIVYIVASEAEMLALEQQLHESSAHQTDLTQRSVIVISEGQADIYNTIVGEQMATGAFSLVDLR